MSELGVAYLRKKVDTLTRENEQLKSERDAIINAGITAGSNQIEELKAALKRVKEELTIPAAEYVPAIPDCWTIIDNALKGESQ